MTTEEIEKAANEFAEKHGFRVPYDGSNEFYDKVDVRASKDGFKAGAEFADKHWQEKTRWIPIEEKLPEIREKEYMIYAKNNNVTYDYAILLIDTPDSLAYLKLAFTHWKEVDFPNY